jgi:hypothetical protein
MLFPLYLANLGVALFALLPLHVSLYRVTSTRPAAGRLLASWDLEILAELVMDHPTLLAQLQAVFLFVPMAYLILSQALLGGALGALARPRRPRARDFGADALGHFFPLLGLLAWYLVPLALAGAALYLGYSVADGRHWMTRSLALVPGLALWAWADAALDFGRAKLVLDDSAAPLRSLLAGFGVTLKRPLAAMGLHLFLGCLGIAPLALLLLIPSALDAGGPGGVLLAFVGRQVVVFLRVSLRLYSLGAHLGFLGGPAQQELPVEPGREAY